MYLAVNFDVVTPSVVDVHAHTSPTLLVPCPTHPEDGEVVKLHLSIRNHLLQPGLCQGYNSGFVVGPLHQAFSMECVHFVPERLYLGQDDGG